MGYAIFTARKLMLTNRINQLNWRIMQLTQQQQTLSEQAARYEMAMGNMRNLYSSIGSMLNMGLNVGLSAAQNQAYTDMKSGITDYSKTGEIAEQIRLKTQPYTLMQEQVNNVVAIFQQQIDLQKQTQLKQIKDSENNIELQRKSLETQLSAATKELDKVEQAEEKNIEKSAPKYA